MGEAGAVAVLSRRTYKQVEWRLYHYHELRRKAEELAAQRDDVLYRGRMPATPGGGGVAYKSDPTASKVLQMVALEHEQQDAARWVEAIEQTIVRYAKQDKGRLLELKYFSDMDQGYICRVLNIERTTFYEWRNELVTYTALVAAQQGLIRVS